MKAASKLSDVKKVLKEQGQKAWMIENCGMEEEKIYHSVEEMPEKATISPALASEIGLLPRPVNS